MSVRRMGRFFLHLATIVSSNRAYLCLNLSVVGNCAIRNSLEVNEMPMDPVCGMVIPDEHAAVCTTYKSKHYCFCSEECKEEFDMDPEMYIAEGEMNMEEEEAF